MGICGNGMAGGFVMTTLGGDGGDLSSWGRRIGIRIERGQVRVSESVARGGFTCGGLLFFVQHWIA